MGSCRYLLCFGTWTLKVCSFCLLWGPGYVHVPTLAWLRPFIGSLDRRFNDATMEASGLNAIPITAWGTSYHDLWTVGLSSPGIPWESKAVPAMSTHFGRPASYESRIVSPSPRTNAQEGETFEPLLMLNFFRPSALQGQRCPDVGFARPPPRSPASFI